VNYGPFAYLGLIGILPDLQRRGIGRRWWNIYLPGSPAHIARSHFWRLHQRELRCIANLAFKRQSVNQDL